MATAFQMEPDLIVSDYRQAANKQKQIEILANLNLCSPREIACLLRDHGEELPSRWVKQLEKPSRMSEENRKKMSEAQKARQARIREEKARQEGFQGVTVGELRRLLADLPESCPVLMDGDAPLMRVSFFRQYDAGSQATTDAVCISGDREATA